MHQPGGRTSDYHFDLPADLIAQQPPAIRGDSRLLVLDRGDLSIRHLHFSDLPRLIPSGDVLVRNTSRVVRARLLGERDSGAPAEILLLRPLGGLAFEAMVRPGGKLKPGRTVHVGPELDVRITGATDRGTRTVELVTSLSPAAAMERYGHVPLPPYIERGDTDVDSERYQTVYSRESGSVAAPTAGLHFTRELLDTLSANDVITADVVLHVGAGTFKPIEVDDPDEHVMHEESFELPEETATALNDARARAACVWAVGTTTVRALESAASPDGMFSATAGETRIFIRPPFTFRAVDHLLTNFHLPGSTLIMLVAAFAGYDFTMRAYETAVKEQYRFFSYGDAMLIL